MRWFYNVYPDYNKINESLSWSHYVELITIKDEDKRNSLYIRLYFLYLVVFYMLFYIKIENL